MNNQARMLQDAEEIGHYLTRLFGDEGIVEPGQESVLPHSYATEYYAWLCALLYTRTGEDHWYGHAVRAVEASLAFFRFARGKDATPLKYHWEFKNLALLNVDRLLADRLPVDLQDAMEDALLEWQDWNVLSANWIAMRMLNYELRYQKTGKISDRIRSRLERQMLLNSQTADGFFPDRPTSFSLQYHAYTLSLLALYYEQTQDDMVWEALNKGSELLRHFVDPDGEFNYYGRGQRQVFGYASLVLAFSILSRERGLRGLPDPFAGLSSRVLQYVRSYRSSDGVFPIVLNRQGKPYGWYYYNLTTDYLAFYGVFIALAQDALPTAPAPAVDDTNGCHIFSDAGLAVIKRDELHAVVAFKSRETAEPLGLVHLWPGNSTAFGGPELTHSLDALDYSLNTLGPLIAGRPLLREREGLLQSTRTGVCVKYSFAAADLQQRFEFYPHVRCGYTLWPRRRDLKVRLLSIAKNGDTFASDIPVETAGTTPSPDGLRQRLCSGEVTLNEPVAYYVEWTDIHVSEGEPSRGAQEIGDSVRLANKTRLKLATLVWKIWVRLIAIRQNLLTA